MNFRNLQILVFTLEYDRELANHPIETEAKNRLKALSKDEYEEFAERLKAKDASYFLLDEIFPITGPEKNMGLKIRYCCNGRRYD